MLYYDLDCESSCVRDSKQIGNWQGISGTEQTTAVISKQFLSMVIKV